MGQSRQNALQLVHYLRFKVNFNDAGSGVAVLKQRLPKGSIPLRSTILKTTQWNSATSAALNVGFVGGTGTELVNAADVRTAAGQATGTLSGNALTALALETQVQASVTFVGAPTAGAAYVVVEYIPDNDMNAGQ